VTTWVALLRGINVGGKRKVAMPALRAAVEELGHTAVRTYINSGNVVLTTTQRSEAAVRKGLEQALEEAFGFTVPVVLRSREQLQAVLKNNPFEGADPKHLHVTFLDRDPGAAAKRAVDPDAFEPERYEVRGRDVYLHLPDGLGRSKLAGALAKKDFGVVGTTRTWATTQKLAALLG
jgi:uncharacterized protein (DUF1697 family)